MTSKIGRHLSTGMFRGSGGGRKTRKTNTFDAVGRGEGEVGTPEVIKT